MPHFGLMDEDLLGPVEGPLMRAKLHIRGGKRRLRQGKISYGIVTLYDALISAMQWYITSPERRKALQIKDGEDMKDDRTIFKILIRSGVIEGDFDYEKFNGLVETALEKEMSDYNFNETLKGIESVMTQLGVMPFEESKLHSEDPETF